MARKNVTRDTSTFNKDNTVLRIFALIKPLIDFMFDQYWKFYISIYSSNSSVFMESLNLEMKVKLMKWPSFLDFFSMFSWDKVAARSCRRHFLLAFSDHISILPLHFQISVTLLFNSCELTYQNLLTSLFYMFGLVSFGFNLRALQVAKKYVWLYDIIKSNFP